MCELCLLGPLRYSFSERSRACGTCSRFDYFDNTAAVFGHRFFRAVMQEHLFDSLGLSLNPNHHARLSISNAQPAHTLVLAASEDLRHWSPLATNTPATVADWLFLDTNAPAFEKRFYRVVGQGK